MAQFVPQSNRDAWSTIRGYVYQVDLTIERWLNLPTDHVLELECGEDIDLVSQAFLVAGEEQQRLLEQVKHREQALTLRTPAALEALANAITHRHRNPDVALFFRYTTNARIARERASGLPDRLPAIKLWELLRTGIYPRDGVSVALAGIRALLQNARRPQDLAEDNWQPFLTFVGAATDDELLAFITAFEWSAGTVDAISMHRHIPEILLRKHHARDVNESQEVYQRLFFFVFKLLSQPGTKRLTQQHLQEQLARPLLGDADRVLLHSVVGVLDRLDQRVQILEQNSEHQSTVLTRIEHEMEQLVRDRELDVAVVPPVRLHTLVPPLVFFGRYMEQGRIFHHRLPQVGRRTELKELLNFVGGKNQIAVLPGRGGSGKSKLLHTFCRRLERWYPDLSVRLVAENLTIKETALQELPDDQCLIIIDDAHRTNGIEVILAAAQQNPRLKILLVTRPHAIEYLTGQASKAGFDHNDIIVYKHLTELNYARQHRRLARLVLGPDWDHYADDLAAATRDSPLLTILGGELLRSEQVSPAFLSQDNRFRQVILSRFRDIRLGEIITQLDSRFTQQVCAEVLQLIAVFTPFNLNHTALVQATAQLAGIDEVKLKQLVGILVEAGALVRGGKLVRIVPDVLSDFILHEACFTRDGVPTGWANKVYQAVSEFGLDLVSGTVVYGMRTAI